MTPVILFFVGLIVLAVFVLTWVLIMRMRRRLSKSATSRIRSLIEKANHLPDHMLRILEYDKVLDQLLAELGFDGSTGDKLKKGGARFSNKQALWNGHKIRNTLAHAHGAQAKSGDADSFRDALVRALAQVGS